ncbi:MAG: XisI protein [Phaeodactylibacter sp.]|nr:XisI protein [Phaeodactylibacter sp.]
MAEVNKYQDSILKVLEEYKGRFKKSSKDIQPLIIADKEKRHYQLLWLGWDGNRHIFTVTTFLSIINGKIWVQHDSTEVGIANLLVEEGIPKSDIVLGYFPSDHRALTEFAAA